MDYYRIHNEAATEKIQTLEKIRKFPFFSKDLPNLFKIIKELKF